MTSPASVALTLAYRVAVLVFIENTQGEQLLLLRAKSPNRGCWSPIGGKLETAIGESPFECAARETAEETGFHILPGDLHLFAMISEKAYEGEAHWLLFVFRCRRALDTVPATFDEGRFAFFSRAAIDTLPIPETDRVALWPTYDRYRDQFVAIRADCGRDQPVRIVVEQVS